MKVKCLRDVIYADIVRIYKVHPFDGDLLVLLSVGSSGLYEEYLCSIEDFVSIEDYRDNQLKELGI